jgi:hypothetical protein
MRLSDNSGWMVLLLVLALIAIGINKMKNKFDSLK